MKKLLILLLLIPSLSWGNVKKVNLICQNQFQMDVDVHTQYWSIRFGTVNLGNKDVGDDIRDEVSIHKASSYKNFEEAYFVGNYKFIENTSEIKIIDFADVYKLNRKNLNFIHEKYIAGKVYSESHYSCEIIDGDTVKIITDLATKERNKLEEGNLL